ncbi:hypothetical protein ACFX13_034838 [Malus domestica]
MEYGDATIGLEIIVEEWLWDRVGGVLEEDLGNEVLVLEEEEIGKVKVRVDSIRDPVRGCKDGNGVVVFDI